MERKYCYGISIVEPLLIIVAIAILAYFIIPIFQYGRGEPRPYTCLSNQRQIAACLHMYAHDHEGMLPENFTIWGDIKIHEPVLICPQDKNTPNGYLYNNTLSGVKIDKISTPEKKMMTIDGKTTNGPNRSINNIYYTPADVLFRHYEKEKNVYKAIASFADGHVEMVNKVKEPQSWDKPIVQKKTGVKK
jgi:prepilin-type processing-associated H-X9-DG protein